MGTISARLAVALLVALIFAVEAAESTSRAVVPSDIWFPTKPDHSWHPIKGSRLKDQKVWDIARFAVATYNGKWAKEKPRKLLSVDEGEILAVGGTVYHLYLTVSNNVLELPKKYHTFVFMYPGTRWESLLFEPLTG